MRFGVLQCSYSFGALALASMATAQSSTETYTYDALGRLVVAQTAGGQNNNETHSLCYDASGNRSRVLATSNGSSANCIDTGAGSAAPTPTPTPTPTPAPNNPPTTVNDTVSGACDTVKTVNLTVNDSDPEGNTPLTLVSVVKQSGVQVTASVVSASSVSVNFGPTAGTAIFQYTVKDSLNASSTGSLTTTSSGTSCGA